ncbi:MAG: RidA family protein [Acidobacteriia bacterium]|nr:RidA family protein [Terriglobia bacterium]
MKLRALSFAVFLLLSITAVAADSDRKHIVLPRAPQASALPFSEGVLVGNTLYVAGHIGIDPKTGKPGASAEDEAKLVMEGIKQTVEAAGLSMDDLVSVQVFCSDVANYDAFNAVYRTYFHGEYPARAFLGSGKLLFGARYEVMGIAVKPQK